MTTALLSIRSLGGTFGRIADGGIRAGKLVHFFLKALSKDDTFRSTKTVVGGKVRKEAMQQDAEAVLALARIDHSFLDLIRVWT